MTITAAKGRFMFEVSLGHLFLQTPLGEVYAQRGEARRFDAWYEPGALHWRFWALSGNFSRGNGGV